MKTCSSCGYSNEDDAMYCASCGAPLSSADGASIVKEDVPPADYNYSDSSGDNGPISTPGSSAYGENGGSSKQPGSGQATASLVLGIISIVCIAASWMYLSIVSIILGIVGLVLASNAKKQGNTSGIRTGGFVTSLIGLILGVLGFVACACVFAVAGATLAAYPDLLEYYEEYSEYLDDDTFDVALRTAKALLTRR